MNATPWPSLFDGAHVFGTLFLFAIFFVGMTLIGPIGARFTLGRAIERYPDIPEADLDDAVEEEGKRRFWNVPGVLVVLTAAMLAQIGIRYGPIGNHLLRDAGWPAWLAFVVSALPSLFMIMLLNLTSRRLLVRRLDRRFRSARA